MRPSPTLSFCATLICSAIAFSCAHTLESGQEQQPRVLPAAALPDSISFTAYLDAGSKTHFGEEWNVLWSPGDRIKVFNESHPQGLEFTLIGDGGSSVGTFSGPLTGDGPFYVVYPADAAGEMSGTSIAVTLPAIQTYAAGSFGLGANLAAGHAEALEGIRFHNLTGVLSLTLTGEKAIREIKVSAYDEQPLLGTGSIDGWEAESTPVLTLDAGQTAEDFREIILDCGESGVPLDVTTGTAFFLNVPAETLAGGYRIEVCDTEGKAMVKYAKAQTENQVDRSEIVQMPTLAYSPAYKAAFLQSGTIGAFRNASSPGSGMTPLCEYAEGKS